MNHPYLDNIQFSALDLHFARFLSRISRDDRPEVFWAAALVSRSTGEGNICIDLPAWAGIPPIPRPCSNPLMVRQAHHERIKTYRSSYLTARPEPVEGRIANTDTVSPGGVLSFFTPAYKEWYNILKENSAVGRPGDYLPLILDYQGRLYLYRYWDYENILAQFIRDRMQTPPLGGFSRSDASLIREKLNLLFPVETGIPGPNWQKLAAATALFNKFTVISGSPGTGKTTTVTKLMALLLETASDRRLPIALAAPTGKAAVRLQEAVKKTKPLLPCSEVIRAAIPEQATTIHRLLGSLSGSPYFRYNRENPLPLSAVIVDEASMVDLPLLSKLVQALPPQAKLILLGDRDQLTSVEAGAVLGDICGSAPLDIFSSAFIGQLEGYMGEAWQGSLRGGGSGLQDCLVQLQHNYRFGVASGIGNLSALVQSGDGQGVVSFLKEGGYDDIAWNGFESGGFLRFLRERVVSGYRDYLKAAALGDVQEMFALFEGFRILCALRRGPWGVEALNSTIERLLTEEGLIDPRRRWYRGRPVMVTRNDYQQRLFNGDVGIILADQDSDGELRVFFRDESGAVRKFLPMRLPEHATVFAMTVHKSQGSEFDRVTLILPDQDVPLLTRELIYTGITRARKGVEVWGAEEILRLAVSRRIARTSGLRDSLWRLSDDSKGGIL